MANVHIKTAAANLRRAVSDLQSQQNELKASLSKQLKEIDAQKDKLRYTEAQQIKGSVKEEDPNAKVQRTMVAERMHHEIDHLEKHKSEIQQDVNGQISALSTAIDNYKNLASQLEMQA